MECPQSDREHSASPSTTPWLPPSPSYNPSPESSTLPMDENEGSQVPRIYRGMCISPVRSPTPQYGSFYRGAILSRPKPYPRQSTIATRTGTFMRPDSDLSTLRTRADWRRTVGTSCGRTPSPGTLRTSPPTSGYAIIPPSKGSAKITWSNPATSTPRVEHGSMVYRALGKVLPYVLSSQTSTQRMPANGGTVIRRKTQFCLTTLEQVRLDGSPDSSKSGPTNMHSSVTLKAGRYVFVPDDSSLPVSSLFENCSQNRLLSTLSSDGSQ